MTTETIRAATPGDIPGLSALFREVFCIDRPESLWRWKFFGNPLGGASFLCEADGRVVAHCGGTPITFADGARRYLALQSVDFMSSAAYAGGLGGGGVFVRTAQRFFEERCGPGRVPLVYGFPGERHRLLGERLLGYRPVEQVGELRRQSSAADGVSLPLTAGQLSLFERPLYDFGGIRDRRYLQWRYLDHPLHEYRLVMIRRPWSLRRTAAIIRRTQEALYVMEIGGSTGSSDLKLLSETLGRFGVPAIFWGGPSHPFVRRLIDTGFELSVRDHWLECRFFDERPTPREGEMYFTLGDYDVY